MTLHRIILPVLMGISLYGMEFGEFYKEALKNSPYLKGNALKVDAAKEEAAIATRYKNPTLELEYSQFDAADGSSDNGQRVALSQPVRLWGVGDARNSLARGVQNEAASSYALTKAIFTKKLLGLYVGYKRNAHLFKLAQQASEITKRIYDISLERYQNGTIAKADMIQSKLDYKLALAKQRQAELVKLQSYYDLLAFAGFTKEIELESEYTEQLAASNIQSNPLLQLYYSRAALADSKERLFANKNEWIDIYAEYEGEPNDDIYRVGLNIPIAFFNTRKEERTKAMLEAKSAKLLAENTKRSLDIKLIALNKKRTLQKRLIKRLEEGLQEGEELLALFEEGYRIANVNIVQLQQVKAALIKTKASLIDAKTKLELNNIETNYLQGKYND